MAESGLLDVSRDERRHSGAGRALRVDLEPELRRTAGARRPHASDESSDGGCGGDRGTTGGCAEPVAVTAPSSSEWTVYGAAIERLPGRILRFAQDDRAGTLP